MKLDEAIRSVLEVRVRKAAELKAAVDEIADKPRRNTADVKAIELCAENAAFTLLMRLGNAEILLTALKFGEGRKIKFESDETDELEAKLLTPDRVTVDTALSELDAVWLYAPRKYAVEAKTEDPCVVSAAMPDRAAVDVAVKLDVELSAESAYFIRTPVTEALEDADALAVVRITTKRPTAVELKARSMLLDTSTDGFDEPTTLKAKSVEVDMSTASFDELVSPKSRSMLALTPVNTSAAAVMLPDAVRLAAPRNDAVDA